MLYCKVVSAIAVLYFKVVLAIGVLYCKVVSSFFGPKIAGCRGFFVRNN